MKGYETKSSLFGRVAAFSAFYCGAVCLTQSLVAQSVAASTPAPLQTMPNFLKHQDGLTLYRHVRSELPFTVAGERGVVVGQQEGSFEAWILPVKLLSHFMIRAEVEGYPVPIELNPAAAEIEVCPDHTTIVYSHIAFTVRQTMFAPDEAEQGTGAVVLFQFDSTRPMDLTFSFTPEVRPMWPQPNEGVASPEWVKREGSGFYLLHLDLPDMAAAVGMPHTQPGVLAPFQERPQFHPLQMKLHYDPKVDRDSLFPLLMAVGITRESATSEALESKLQRLGGSLEQLYTKHAARNEAVLQGSTSIETPDKEFNQDFRWAEISIEQLKAKAQPSGEVGLVAGYYSSGDSARPGFGWFFGRDSLYTLYAVDSYGDLALSRNVLEFLIKRQRQDGKIMHEYSQTAAFVDWKSLPYMYAAADSTPLFLMAMWDYARSSGDTPFVKSNRAAIEKAWQFETTHDSDGDGIYDNSQGSGWVEGWTRGMPHQEIYLASLDQQASTAMVQLSQITGDADLSTSARDRAGKVARQIEAEYYDPTRHQYSFSYNADGADRTATVYPAIAWWDSRAGIQHPEESLTRWASHDFSTDWGIRDVAADDPIYDPISYHQGSVWPLFTGWASLAEYRAGRPLSGYAHLMQNADLTTAQDLGAVTELLSGDYFQPFGRSTSHQLWSSAMVITPALRGLFGIDIDALNRTVSVQPNLPADWDSATVRHLKIGGSIVDLAYNRQGGSMEVRMTSVSGPAIRIISVCPDSKTSADGALLACKLPPVEVSISHELPLPGARTTQLKVLSQKNEDHALHLRFEGQAGSAYELKLRRNGVPMVKAVGAKVKLSSSGEATLVLRFAAGSGYQKQDVTVTW